MADGPEPKAKDARTRLRPTVVGGPAARGARTAPGRPEPTAMSDRLDHTAQPLVLPEPGRPSPEPIVAAPEAAPGAARTVPPLPSPSMRRAISPTAIPGEEPRRVAIGATDLAQLAPGTSPAVRERALALLKGMVLDRSGERRALLWGHDLQREHGALMSQGLDLARSEALARVTVHLSRLATILASIDVEAATGVAPGSGMLGRVLRQAGPRIDTPEELTRARVEIDQLLALLGEALPRLMSLKAEIEDHWTRIEAVGDEAEGLALAAEALSLRLQPSRPDLARIYLDRSIALAQTVAQVRSGAGLREAQVEQPLRLIAAIQDLSLVSLPGWLGALAALETAAAQRRATPTQAGELAHRLRGILQTLNP